MRPLKVTLVYSITFLSLISEKAHEGWKAVGVAKGRSHLCHHRPEAPPASVSVRIHLPTAAGRHAAASHTLPHTHLQLLKHVHYYSIMKDSQFITAFVFFFSFYKFVIFHHFHHKCCTFVYIIYF